LLSRVPGFCSRSVSRDPSPQYATAELNVGTFTPEELLEKHGHGSKALGSGFDLADFVTGEKTPPLLTKFRDELAHLCDGESGVSG
jgi:hypothetical protein